MSEFKKNPSSAFNRRKPVEIYFVLYLSALVILMSGQNDNTNKDNTPIIQKNVELPFRVSVEKPMLICKVTVDSTGNRKIHLDSINYIWDVGKVKNVKYEFVIEDQDLRHSVKLSDNSSHANKYFSFKQDKENRRVTFCWLPEILTNDNKTFIVYVTATANSSDSESDRKIIVARTQFSLVITNDNFANDGQLVNNNNHIDTIRQNLFIPQQDQYFSNYYSSLADFSIRPQETKIRGVSYQAWENEIQCYGIYPTINLKKTPTVKIQNYPENNGGIVNSPIIKENSIIIRGKVPYIGHSKVFVTVTRKNDLKEVTVSFEVFPISYEQADFPAKMYPGIEYEFNPKLSTEIGAIAVYIKDNDNVRFSGFGTAFKFTPNISDVGKTFSFERYINGQQLGEKYYIKIYDFPEPEITRITSQNKNDAILEVVSFGMYNGRENNISDIKIIGNAKSSQRYGKYRRDKQKMEFYEQFQIVPIDSDKPFNFEVIAIDQRGYKSKSKKYPEN